MSRIDDEAFDWAARHAAGELDEEARAAFAAWSAASPRHQGAYLRALAIRHHHSGQHVPAQAASAPDGDAAPTRHARHRRALLFSGALAAGLAAVTVSRLTPPVPERAVYRTARGEVRKIPLADGSVVELDSESRVEVELAETERRLFVVEGEAWFDVARDAGRPFVVAAGEVRVRAVGTAFAVRRGAAGADVLVTEGVVEVWSDVGSAGRRRVAAGGRAFVGESATAIAVAQDPDEIARRLAWRDGQLVFANETLAAAVARFNRYNLRPIDIVDPALRRRTLVGSYGIGETERFADDVRTLWNVPVTIGADAIRIGVAPAAQRSHGAE